MRVRARRVRIGVADPRKNSGLRVRVRRGNRSRGLSTEMGARRSGGNSSNRITSLAGEGPGRARQGPALADNVPVSQGFCRHRDYLQDPALVTNVKRERLAAQPLRRSFKVRSHPSYRSSGVALRQPIPGLRMRTSY